ncbi:MAG: hypothetical protein AB7V48_14570 [Sedimentibacter sp.]
MKRIVGLIIVAFEMKAYASDEKPAGEISPMYIDGNKILINTSYK